MYFVSSYGTLKNNKLVDKPNEDFVICDDRNGIYILLDGVSRDTIDGKYPIPSPAKEVSELFAETVYDFLKKQKKIYSKEVVRTAFVKGNESIKQFNLDYKGDFLPGTVGIVCVICEDNMYFGYIGDCYGRLIRNDRVDIFTECQTEQIAQHKKEFTSYEIRNEICNNVAHPYAYGVLTGQEEAINFVRLGQYSLENVVALFLSSDGMEAYLSNLMLKEYSDNIAKYYLDKSIKGEEEDDKALIIIRKI